jgi:hypothetical protein
MEHIQTKIITAVKTHKLPMLCALECIVLEFMIETLTTRTRLVSIHTIYSIIECYSKCDKESLKHFYSEKEYMNCSCSELSNNKKTNPNTSNALDKATIVHYETLYKIVPMCKKYNEILKSVFPDQKFKYNVDYKLSIGDKSSFILQNKVDIIGYSNTQVIYFILKPQFNSLNYYSTLFMSILIELLIQFYSGDEDKFRGKLIRLCIFTLDSDTPIFHTWNMEQILPKLKEVIASYFKDTYISYHSTLIDYYKKLLIKDTQAKAKDTQAEAKAQRRMINTLKKFNNLPQHVKDCFVLLAEDNNVEVELEKKLDEKINYFIKVVLNCNKDCDDDSDSSQI